MDSCNAMENLRNSLIALINESGLTVGAGLFIVKDIYNSLYLLYLEQLKTEQETTHEQESVSADLITITEEE